MSQNKGFSFIAVIVVMLVSIFLIVSCLTIVNNTYNMKHTEDKVSTVFYNAEGKMEQVKAKIVLDCKTSAEKAYTYVLSNLDNIPEGKYKDAFAIEYVNDILKEYTDKDLKEYYENSLDFVNANASFLDRITKCGNNSANVTIEVTKSDKTLDSLTVPKSIVVKGLSVKEEGNGYDKTVSSDIVITPPDFFNKAPISDDKVDYQDFVFVSDDYIKFSGKNLVDGSIYATGHSNEGLETSNQYAGTGIVVDKGSDVVINGLHYFLTKGTFNLKPNSSVKIAKTNMFVNRILLDTKASTYADGDKTTLNINGNINVKEDFDVDIKGSDVKLTGEYTGYSEDENPSSIVINEGNSNVDLTGLTDLTLSGLTYVRNKEKGETFGSSLDAKFMQTMYLVPSECITWKNDAGKNYHSNPVPISDKEPDINLSKCKTMKLETYCDGTYEVSNNGYSYYFLKFKDGKAAEYANMYLHKKTALMNLKAKTFQYGNIYLSQDTKVTAKGIIVGYENNQLVISNTNTECKTGLFDKTNTIKDKADKLLNTLSETKENKNTDSSIFSYLFKELKPNNSNMVATTLYSDDDCDGKGYTVKIVDGDYQISGVVKGLIIATGKVTITDNSQIIGNVFAGKGIEVGANVFSYSSDTGIYPFVYLTQNYSKKNEVRKYFNNLEIVKDLGNNASANVEENVTYENWKSE